MATNTTSSEPRLIPIGKSTCAQDVINATVDWAIAISKDNNFHYGKKPGSCHNGCYFCGTQPKVKRTSGIKGWEKTYCCNPFINAAFAHGGGEPTALKKCKSGSSWDHAANAGYNTSKLFENLGHPKKSKLVKGDVLCRHHGTKGHVALYIGDGKIVEASGGDNNKRFSESWNHSIRVRELSDSNYNKFQRVHRYIGKGGGMMHVYGTDASAATTSTPTTSDSTQITDSGVGLNLQQTISKLYSSENYTYLNLEEKEDTTDELIETFTDKIKSVLFNTNYTQSTETSALPEPVINNIVELADFEKDKPKKILQSKPTQLLSYPTLVEAPTIVLDFNGIKIGGYGNRGDKYPNYITSMSVKKINGRINQYVFNLAYQVRPGEDPNFIDKLIARTGYTSPLKILYGDSNYPNAYYREESAIITDARHNEDTSAYRINYTINALSSVSASQSSLTVFESKQDKPSNIIYKLLYDSGEISTNLLKIFPGMKNKLLVSSKNLIPTTDSIVTVSGMSNVSPLTYLSYLVACMNNPTNKSSYYLNLVDNSRSEFDGSYFEIKEVINQTNTEISQVSNNCYELDIGYPTNNYIMNFQLCNNNYWSLVYNYAGSIPKFEYGIDDNGDLITKETNALYINDRYSESNLVSANWWKQVTEYPISAKVTLKGLINPAILMSYIKVNALFYGEKDMASGLYVVTQQEDSISGSGYSTELTLLRVAGE